MARQDTMPSAEQAEALAKTHSQYEAIQTIIKSVRNLDAQADSLQIEIPENQYNDLQDYLQQADNFALNNLMKTTITSDRSVTLDVKDNEDIARIKTNPEKLITGFETLTTHLEGEVDALMNNREAVLNLHDFLLIKDSIVNKLQNNETEFELIEEMQPEGKILIRLSEVIASGETEQAETARMLAEANNPDSIIKLIDTARNVAMSAELPKAQVKISPEQFKTVKGILFREFKHHNPEYDLEKGVLTLTRPAQDEVFADFDLDKPIVDIPEVADEATGLFPDEEIEELPDDEAMETEAKTLSPEIAQTFDQMKEYGLTITTWLNENPLVIKDQNDALDLKNLLQFNGVENSPNPAQHIYNTVNAILRIAQANNETMQSVIDACTQWKTTLEADADVQDFVIEKTDTSVDFSIGLTPQPEHPEVNTDYKASPDKAVSYIEELSQGLEDPSMMTDWGRAIEETLTNAIKYGDNYSAHVHIEKQGNDIVVEITNQIESSTAATEGKFYNDIILEEMVFDPNSHDELTKLGISESEMQTAKTNGLERAIERNILGTEQNAEINLNAIFSSGSVFENDPALIEAAKRLIRKRKDLNPNSPDTDPVIAYAKTLIADTDYTAALSETYQAPTKTKYDFNEIMQRNKTYATLNKQLFGQGNMRASRASQNTARLQESSGGLGLANLVAVEQLGGITVEATPITPQSTESKIILRKSYNQ